MSIKPWKVLETKYLHPGFRIDKCRVANGKIFEPMVLEFHSWANVLALTKNREAILVKQYRHGVQEVLLEFPGGVVEDNESPLSGVKRELLEETGYTTDKFIEVGKFYPNPALQNNMMYCFLALDAKKVRAQELDEVEDIEVHLVPLDELILMAKNGKFSHALQVAALFRILAYLNRIN